ncbi:MAG: riboflavin synthase [Wenzhouxiangella sp.]
MFTGIVKAMGRVASLEPAAGGARIRVDCPALQPERWRPGDSVAVAGCCLTVLDPDRQGFSADLSPETLARTGLGGLAAGDRVNLEPALAAGEPLGGHFVTGHVDALAELIGVRPAGGNRVLRFRVPQSLEHLVAEKGSVTLDGVSLTVNAVDGCEFEVNIIPHTLEITTLGRLAAGDRVNLEVDLIARYLERLAARRGNHAV